MSSVDEFNPGDGWRRLDPYEETHRPHQRTLTEHDADGKSVAYWVRELSVLQLPTEPHTVIQVRWKQYMLGRDDIFTLKPSRTTTSLMWDSKEGAHDADWLSDHTTGFGVLAEPRTSLDRHRAESVASVRRETAKTVLDRIAAEPWAREVDLAKWRFDFEVDR